MHDPSWDITSHCTRLIHNCNSHKWLQVHRGLTVKMHMSMAQAMNLVGSPCRHTKLHLHLLTLPPPAPLSHLQVGHLRCCAGLGWAQRQASPALLPTAPDLLPCAPLTPVGSLLQGCITLSSISNVLQSFCSEKRIVKGVERQRKHTEGSGHLGCC